MPLIRLILCCSAIGLMGCATLPLPQASDSVAKDVSPVDRVEDFPDVRSMSPEFKALWMANLRANESAGRTRAELDAELDKNPTARRAAGKVLTQWIDVAYNEGEVPEDLESREEAARLIDDFDAELLLELIAPSLEAGMPLENVLIQGDPALARKFESAGANEEDPGFGLYLAIIDEKGLKSPQSQPLIHRMIYVRPMRAMDSLLDRYGSEIPDAMTIFGVLQGIRRQQMRESLGESSPRDTLNWMTRTLSPLQGHELPWVRYYARRVLELQVRQSNELKKP